MSAQIATGITDDPLDSGALLFIVCGGVPGLVVTYGLAEDRTGSYAQAPYFRRR